MNKRSGGETRRKILAAAQRIFTDQGYEAASMRTIARAAGISVGCLYLYFENKSDLYITILREWLDGLQGLTLGALARADGPRDELAVFVSTTFQYAREHRELLLLQRSEAGCGLGVELKREFFRTRRDLLADIVRRGTEEMVFVECDPAEMAAIIFTLIRGFMLSLLIDGEAAFDAASCTDLILNGLTRRNDG